MPDLPQPDEGIGALFVRLVDDTRAFVRAEIALYRAQIVGWIRLAKVVAILGIAALMLVGSAVIALIVGLLLTLAPHIGPGWATLIVVAGTLTVAALLGWLAYRRITKMLAERATA